ncbi:helix-turn-helix domain-containing protein, partial [Desulfovibrio sp. OttesenSCG-928-I05]|nr:helix-turn-helix domain-containing protein [Desulfovibrio sp. OttesenSCG-928-I05]
MNTKNHSSYEPDYAIPAGESVKEYMESMGITQKEFAIRLGMTEQSLIRMYSGKQPLTYETANRLEKVTGVSANFWNKREQIYRERQARFKEAELGTTNKDWIRKFPLDLLQSQGFIPKSKDNGILYASLLHFFGVATVDAWDALWKNPRALARRSRSLCFDSSPYKAATWIRMGELEAQKLSCSPTNKKAFNDILPEIRSLTRLKQSEFMPKMQELCKEVGVALVFVP